MEKQPKSKIKTFLRSFRYGVEFWLKSNPDRELLQIAHAQIGAVYNKIGNELKRK